MTVHQLAGRRLAGMLAAPSDAVALVECAIARTDSLAELIRASAPAPEVTAAAQAVAALAEPLASLRLTAGVLDAALRLGGGSAARRASGARPGGPAARSGRPRLRAIQGGKDTPGGGA